MNITVYVPDDLGSRIELQRGNLKLSEIFQEAIEDKLARLEVDELADLDPDNERQLERLIQSKYESDKRWNTKGERDGMLWALKEAVYDQVAILTSTAKMLEGSILSEEYMLEQIYEAANLTEEELLGEGKDIIPNAKAYAEGFLLGVAAIHSRLPDEWVKCPDPHPHD